MEYSEWIAKSDVEMAELGIEGVLDMLSKLPYGMIEPDLEKQAKISAMILVYCGSALVSHNEDFLSTVSSMVSSMITLLPDDTHAQSYSYGVYSVLRTVEKTNALLNQRATATQG